MANEMGEQQKNLKGMVQSAMRESSKKFERTNETRREQQKFERNGWHTKNSGEQRNCSKVHEKGEQQKI